MIKRIKRASRKLLHFALYKIENDLGMEFKPDNLRPKSRLWMFRKHLKSDKSIYWSYKPWGGPKIETDYNAGCYDITKRKVQRVMEEALGYTQRVDPTKYEGVFISKGNLQCTHDAVVYDKPIKPKDVDPRKVYSKKFDNSVEIRYFYCRTGEDFYILKGRELDDFSMSFNTAYIYNKTLPGVDKFCKAFGLDFGELDILFGPDDRLYVIDVNNIAGRGGLINRCNDPKLFKRLYINQVKTL